jgi:[calcium/calmodulin-dependent protein kinase] kinase
MSALLTSHVTRQLTCSSRISQYKVLKDLGEGSFGEVKLCEYKGKLYAAKIMSKSRLRKRREMVVDESGQVSYKDALMDVRREIAIMKKLTHRNVVKLIEVIDDVLSDEIIMSKAQTVLDYCQKGQIMEWNEDTQRFECEFDSRPQLDEESIRKYFRDMVCGLEYCED